MAIIRISFGLRFFLFIQIGFYSATKTARGTHLVAGVYARRKCFDDVNEPEKAVGSPKTVSAVLTNFGFDIESMVLINFVK